MTAQDRTTLAQAFQNGDRPQGSDYVNLIDSALNIAETTAQTVQGQVTFAGGFSAAAVGGVTGSFTGTVTAATFHGVNGNFTTVSAQSANLGAVTLSALTIPASGVTVAGPIIFSSFGANVSTDGSVACTGTTQGSAKLLGAYFNVLKTVATAATDAVRLPGLFPGAMFVISNDTTGSAQVFPPSGAQFNAAGANAKIDIGPRGAALANMVIACISSTQAYVFRAG